MTCTIIGAVVSCVLGTPPLPPAEALRIWQAARPPYTYTPPPAPWQGPVFVVVGQGSTTPWPWPDPRPALRLDGTRLDHPPTVYRTRLPRGWDRPAGRRP